MLEDPRRSHERHDLGLCLELISGCIQRAATTTRYFESAVIGRNLHTGNKTPIRNIILFSFVAFSVFIIGLNPAAFLTGDKKTQPPHRDVKSIEKLLSDEIKVLTP